MGKENLRIIDLSVPLRNHSMEPQAQSITYLDHFELARLRGKTWGINPVDFPGGNYFASDEVCASTHAGTHLDAPWHYGPKIEGMPAKTIDEIPLEWCYGDGVVLDLSHKERGGLISSEDIQGALKRIEYQIKPFDIVLIRTGSDKYFDNVNYAEMHAGMSKEATLMLVDLGVKIMGTDGWSFDQPIPTMVKELKKGNRDRFFPSHYAGRIKEYCHIEKLANLHRIPMPYGFRVAVFPIKIQRASAAWCRAVAIVE